MTARELAFIRAAAVGLRRARADLAAPDADKHLAAALEQLFEDHPGPLGNGEVAYLAAMLTAWQDQGSPDLLA